MNLKILEDAKNLLTSILEILGLAWWVEIVTDKPSCIYYFGPFLSKQEAKLHCPGYIEDLEQEDAVIVSWNIKQYQPKQLTIYQED
ncbi:MAG TPA: DUF1816 domain-containing protein [Chroococcales cyanobacterium]|jgi:hypothetical protein